MNYRIFTLGLLASLLCGCGRPVVWVKPGASQQDLLADRDSCERKTPQSGYFGGGSLGDLKRQAFFKSCMNAHGWHPQ